MLYNCRTDSLIPGMTLWGSEALKTTVSKTPLETSDFEVIAEDSLKEKTAHLGVDANLKLSLLSGMVDVGGAAKFLYDRKSSKNQARVSLKSKFTTTFEQLTMDQLGNIEYENIFDTDTATHVVTAVLYGADAFFVFDREAENIEDVKNMHGKLKIQVGGLPGLETLASIGGEGSGGVDTADKDEEEKINCKFYGDFILPRQPATFREAAKVYQELPDLLKERPVPKRVWLYPLSKLDSRAHRMVREISSRLIDDLHQLMESLHEITMRSNDLIRTEVCSYFHGLKDQLKHLNKIIDRYRSKLEKDLAELLPKVRGGVTGEAKLAEMLESNTQSPFSCQYLPDWINKKESEVHILTQYLKHLKQQEQIEFAFGPGEMEKFTNDLEIETVLCFDFGISWRRDAYLESMEAFILNSKENQKSSFSQPWYHNKTFMQTMRNQFRCFEQFVSANRTSQSDAVKYIVTNSYIEATDDTASLAFVFLYKNAFPTVFKLPDQPSCLQASVVSCDSIQLKWDEPKYGAESVNYYSLFYHSNSEPPNHWLSQTTKDAAVRHFALSGLIPGTTYHLKVRAETVPGCSHDSKECVVTLPPDEPGKPQASNITHNSLQLTWRKPKYGAELVQSYTITFHSFDGKLVELNLSSIELEENADLSGLTPKTSYTFKVRAESTAGPSPDSEPSDSIETTLPVSQPGRPSAAEITHNSIELTWDKPRHGVEILKGYSVFFCTMDDFWPDDSWNSHRVSAPIEWCNLPRLEPNTVYSFKVRAETSLGVGPKSEPTTIATRLPPPLGKPTVSNVTYEDFNVNWLRPNYDDIQHYSVLYQEADEQSHCWHSLTTTGLKESITFSAAQNKQYVFKVAAVTSAVTSSYGEISDPFEVKKMYWGAQIYKRLKQIQDSNPPTYLLPTHSVLKTSDILKLHVGSHSGSKACICQKQNLGVPHKVLMVVGATGAGKTTLINGMANYIMGVDWEDDFRFKLVAEEPTLQDQSKSQAMKITTYTFYKFGKDSSYLNYTLTIVDLPEFGDTGEQDSDKHIVRQIKKLANGGVEGIDQLHGIGFVAQAPLNQLTPAQQYILDHIISLFGKSIANNIFLMITFADGMQPPVLDAAKTADVPFKAFFKFNNSALFTAKSLQIAHEFDSMFWKMNTKSYDEFFSEFSTAKAQSFQQIREVTQDKLRTEAAVQKLQQQVIADLTKIDELRQQEQILKGHKANIVRTKQRKVDLPSGKYTTNCMRCHYTCHKVCSIANDEDKYQCAAMTRNRGKESAECGECPRNCSWRMHANNPYRFELYEEIEDRTFSNPSERYESVEHIEDEIKEMNKSVLKKIIQTRTSIERLQENSSHLTDVEYIDTLIESEESEAKPRWQERVQALEGVRKQADFDSKRRPS